MNNKRNLIEQTNRAFEFMQKLYFETSYLIKEIQGLLNEEEEKFLIGKPAGYGISFKGSTGLEQENVRLWLLRKFGIFFAPAEKMKKSGGTTVTRLTDDLKTIYIRVILHDIKVDQPKIYSGVIYDIQIKKPDWSNKFERLMSHFEYNSEKIFKNINEIDYEDIYIEMKGKLIANNLYEINDSEAIMEKIINPTLELYRSL